MNEYDDKSGALPPPLPPVEENRSEQRALLLGLPLCRRDSVTLVLLTVLADVCLFRAGGGAGGAMLLGASLIALLVLKGGRVGTWPAKACGVILALAAVLVWSAWWLVAVMASFSIFILAAHLWRPDWGFLESLWAGMMSITRAPHRLLGHAVACRAAARTPGRKTLPAKVIAIPVAISVLFLIIFSAANPVVSSVFSRLWDRLADVLVNLSDYLNVGRCWFWAGWLLIFAALIRPVVRSAVTDRLMKMDVDLKSREAATVDENNFLVACATLVCVNIVFLGYNCMDAVYLYFKTALPPGITWTAYTHEGCGWLTFGLLLSTVVLGYVFWDEMNFHARSRLLKGLAALWIAQNLVLALGTLRRVHMYIDFSGLTHLLLTGIYGSLLVMAGVAIMAVKVHRNRSAIWLLRRYIAAFAIGLMALVLTPHGVVCSRYNVARILEEKPHSLWPVCLKELPADALPALVPLLDYQRTDHDAAKEKLVREGIAGILGGNLVRLEQEQSGPWSQWQLSSWWALKHLRAAREKITATVPQRQWDAARDRLKQDYDLSGDSASGSAGSDER